MEVFNVNADLTLAGKGIHGQLVRMSEVEAQRATRGFLRQIRFSLCPVAEFQARRLHLHIAAQQSAQRTPPDDEAPSIAFEMKTCGAIAFIGREQLLQLLS